MLVWWAMRRAILSGVMLGLCGCVEPTVVRPAPGPTKELLRVEDCSVASELYKQRLTMPRRSGTLVSAKMIVRTSEEQSLDWAVFATKCQTELVGRARRTIVGCWQDSTDAETFDSCNDRF